MHYRLAGSKCSLIEISDNASEETIVTCRDAVMVIERDAGDGIDENPVFGSIIHLIGQSWVESVDSFYDEDRSGFKFQLLSIEFPEPRNKIIFRYIHCFSSKKFKNITLQITMIDSLEIVEIKFSVR